MERNGLSVFKKVEYIMTNIEHFSSMKPWSHTFSLECGTQYVVDKHHLELHQRSEIKLLSTKISVVRVSKGCVWRLLMDQKYNSV